MHDHAHDPFLARALAVFAAVIAFALPARAHVIRGSAENAQTNEPAAFVQIQIFEKKLGVVADANGLFTISGLEPGTYTLRAQGVGFEPAELSISIGPDGETGEAHFHLNPAAIALDEVLVSAERSMSAASSRRVRELDLQLRPRDTPQDMLELVPGLVVAQHAGGGKAEQIFLRGFDADHGTDVAINVDGVPVNMVSHGHGQGYADLHFLIPEVVGSLEVEKGPYFARHGDFATAGAVTYRTRERVEHTELYLEGGAWETGKATVVAALPLPSKSTSAYLAASAALTEGPFDEPQDFRRFNVFGRASHQLSESSSLELSLSSFSSTWYASGQIPQRAVASGQIDRFGALDDLEGGGTGRTDLRFAYRSHSADDRSRFFVQAYTTSYDFRLYSNFTFFLSDTTFGDMIEQADDRRIVGILAEHESRRELGSTPLRLLIGASTRVDRTNVELWHDRERERLEPTKSDRVQQSNPALYTEAALDLTPKVELVLGVRADYFRFDTEDMLEDLAGVDTTRTMGTTGVVGDEIVSPKATLIVRPTERLDLFLNTGLGFHSNDTRSVIAEPDSVHLPRASGAEIGARTRIGSHTNLGAAAWVLELDEEQVWVGDGGEAEFSGETRRWGLDLEARTAIRLWLFADVDVNLAQGKAIGDGVEEGADKIPLAPRVTSSGGFTANHPTGWFGTLRYRYVGERPANETGSVRAEGHTLLDASAGRRFGPWSVELIGENLTDAEWNEAQFDTESRIRLPDGSLEPGSVSELHFTPGHPLHLKLRAAVHF